MIIWKQRLMQMHRARTFKFFLTVVLLLSMTSCMKPSFDSNLTVDEWFKLIIDELDLELVDQTYIEYPTNDSRSQQIIQTLAAWNILKAEDDFQLNAKLNNDLFAKTILRISLEDQYDHLQLAYEQKMISSMDPDGTILKEKALNILEEAVNKRNNQRFAMHYEITENPYIKPINKAQWLKDEIIILDKIQLFEDDIIKYKNQFYQISDLRYEEDKIIARTENCDPTKILEDIDISGSFELDLSQAEIVDDGTEGLISEHFSSANYALKPLALPFYKSKTLNVNGYKIEINISNSQLVVNAQKSFAHGMDQYIKLTLNNIKPSFKFKMDNQKIKEGYFKIDFDTIASIGIKDGIAKDLYADFKNIDGSSFLNAATSLFKKQQDIVETTIPLCTIAIPIPQMPLVKLLAKLQLNIYASGRAELSLNSEHQMGMEIVNGNVRLINDHDHKCDFVIKATISTMMRIFFGLDVANMTLMDIYAEPGVKGLIQSQVHIFDSNNEQTIMQSQLPLDFLDTISSENEDILICGDIKAYLVLNVGINSSNSLLGKLNFKKHLSILNERNAPLINDGKYHIENWHFVEKCTRNRILKPQKTLDIIDTTQIIIKDYSLIVAKGKSIKIQITGLPNGYSLDDLEYVVEKPCISVDTNGMVTGVERGSSIVTIQTKDKKYKIECHVLVKGEQI